MNQTLVQRTKKLFSFHWQPSRDLLAIAGSWLLVVAALYTANVIVGPQTGGGLPYFFLYAVLGATLCGVAVPVAWTVFVRKQSIADLGITKHCLVLSLILQVVFAVGQYFMTLAKTDLPPFEQLAPLIALGLAIGFFEAVFWRGWVLLRLEASFGSIPAILIGSLLYAAYHVGYGMPFSEIQFLFIIGLMFSIAFMLTRNVFILWPLFQPMGQLVTLIKDELSLPLIASVGFIEALAVMIVILYFAERYHRKHHPQEKTN
ncbi:MAG: CPBP family intramembrane metalloprotease [Anaerolineaceae bacterium]|nr:CPBP family intramembrane metalloprotease [Anaerolineaceae bacterium]